MEKYMLPSKSDLVQVKLADLELSAPDLRQVEESKSVAIARWMIDVIEANLKSGKLAVNNLLPSKAEFAYFLGVSVGTIQNALRYIEDKGYVESKQRIGTIVKNKSEKSGSMRKLTSKRDIAILEVKKFIVSNKLKAGSYLPSSRAISAMIGCSSNTTRLAFEYLCGIGVLEHRSKKTAEGGWVVKSLNFDDLNSSNAESAQKTLVLKIEKDLKDYIDNNFKPGDRLPSHAQLSYELKASIKTIHDALKTLINDGILLPRRGRYGTTVIKCPKDCDAELKLEKSIFAPAKDTAFYYYEKTQNAIKSMIADNYEIGSKLPSIMELAKTMDLSPNTIRKAFQNLAKEGYLSFTRGRYGGTFVVDIPQRGEEAFKWLAVNPQYAKLYSN